MAGRTHYHTLGIDKNADQATVKSAYRKLVKECHPDKNPGDKNAEARFRDVQTAYEIVGDENKRATYDWELKRGASQEAAQAAASATSRQRPHQPEEDELDLTGTKVVSAGELQANIDKLMKSRLSLTERFRLAAYPKIHLLKDHKCGVTLRGAVYFGYADNELRSINADRTPGIWTHRGRILFSEETARCFNHFSSGYRVPKGLREKYRDLYEDALRNCANYRGVVNGVKKKA